MAASAQASMYLQYSALNAASASILLIYFSGGVVAFPVSLFVMRFVALTRRIEVAFASAFVALSGFTVLITATLYGLRQRAFFAEYHEPAFSTIWYYQTFYTFAGAIYQFAVLGTRLYLPAGIALIFVASLWLAKRMR